MKNLSKTLTGLCVLGMMAAFSSCDDKQEFIGSWTAVSPVDISDGIPSTTVTSVVSISFSDNQQKTDGEVCLSSDYDLNRSVTVDSMEFSTHLTAKAKVNGSWTIDVDDDDDMLLTFDASTLEVTLNPSDISFTPAVSDSLFSALSSYVIPEWKRDVEMIFRKQMQRFSVIEDVEVERRSEILSFEVHSPEAEIHFRRTFP